MIDVSKHPCFNDKAREKFGRIHLPVAPRCNMLCNYCNRKYNCVSESHPGITSAVLTPNQALEYLEEAVSCRPEIEVVGLAGPGDPFANPVETMETLRRVRNRFPDILLCVATSGINLGPYIEELAELGISHVTLTINAIDPQIGKRIYSWIRDGNRPLRGERAAEILWQRQKSAVRKLKAYGITVKVNSIVIPGINDRHMPEVAKSIAELGADVMNCMTMVPVRGSVFGDRGATDGLKTEQVRSDCSKHMPQARHCARCRADAVGLLSEMASPLALKDWVDRQQSKSWSAHRPYVAVASHEGALVNQHLGEAERLWIYQEGPHQGDGFELREHRRTPLPGGGDRRWQSLARLLCDCRALLVVSAGESPCKALKNQGIRVIEMEGLIEDGLTAAFANQEIPPVMKRHFQGCSRGIGCRGTGTGCN